MGLEGNDVRAWEYFLLGTNPTSSIVVDGRFDLRTRDETMRFQRNVGFAGSNVDGIVGPKTYAEAMRLGFDPTIDTTDDESGPNWPPQPDEQPLPYKRRVELFGSFTYVPSPIPSNPEAIVVDNKWVAKNIVTVDVPHLRSPRFAQVHRLVASQFLALFEEWHRLGLIDRILTWDGSWSPRFIRGSRTSLSNHAWGTAFDINAQWNMLGTQPALLDEKGCVRELVKSAHDLGWYWGGWFNSRRDGMHFECVRIVA